MGTSFETIYEKFLMQIDDYELNLIKEYELSNLCYGYLDKAIALYFPQSKVDLTDKTVKEVTYVNGVRIEPVSDTEFETVDETPLEVTEEPTSDSNVVSDEELVEDITELLAPLEDVTEDESVEDYILVVKEGYFNFELTATEQFILALGMKKAWLSSKKFNADLMSKDIGDRDYKAVQGFNYIKELRTLDSELQDEIREYAIGYTYDLDSLTNGW